MTLSHCSCNCSPRQWQSLNHNILLGIWIQKNDQEPLSLTKIIQFYLIPIIISKSNLKLAKSISISTYIQTPLLFLHMISQFQIYIVILHWYYLCHLRKTSSSSKLHFYNLSLEFWFHINMFFILLFIAIK